MTVSCIATHDVATLPQLYNQIGARPYRYQKVYIEYHSDIIMIEVSVFDTVLTLRSALPQAADASRTANGPPGASNATSAAPPSVSPCDT